MHIQMSVKRNWGKSHILHRQEMTCFLLGITSGSLGEAVIQNK